MAYNKAKAEKEWLRLERSRRKETQRTRCG